MKKLSYLLLLFFSNLLIAQDHSVYFIGHSLVGHEIPQMIDQLSDDDTATTFNFAKQIINGSPLLNNWLNPDRAEDNVNYREYLPGGRYDRLIVTEAVPLQNHIKYNKAHQAVNNFYKYHKNTNPNGQMYVYETWHCINSGPGLPGCDWDNDDHIPWRQRIDSELANWESLADSVHIKNPGAEVLLVPGGQGMGKLYDAIERNALHGVSSIKDFYSDDIHLNHVGSYFMACVMYSTIFKRSPEGLTVNTTDIWGRPYKSPGAILGRQLQQIAWRTVCQYPRSGVNCNNADEQLRTADNALRLVDSNASKIRVYANSSELVIKNVETTSYLTLYDISGRVINTLKANKSGEALSIPTNGLRGVYLLSIVSPNGTRFNKKIML